MVKRQLTLYVDSENVEIAKAKGINLSQLFNDVLKTTLEIPEDAEDETLALKEQIKKLQYDKSVVMQKMKALKIKIKQKEKKEDEIKREREKRIVYRYTPPSKR